MFRRYNRLVRNVHQSLPAGIRLAVLAVVVRVVRERNAVPRALSVDGIDGSANHIEYLVQPGLFRQSTHSWWIIELDE